MAINRAGTTTTSTMATAGIRMITEVGMCGATNQTMVEITITGDIASSIQTNAMVLMTIEISHVIAIIEAQRTDQDHRMNREDNSSSNGIDIKVFFCETNRFSCFESL
jgi:hypothetical protein